MKTLVLIAGILAGFSGASLADIVKTAVGKIDSIAAYDDYDNGDVLIWANTTVKECPNGLYLNPEAPGFEIMVSFALAAYIAKLDVLFQVYNDRLLDGSKPYCEADAIRLP